MCCPDASDVVPFAGMNAGALLLTDTDDTGALSEDRGGKTAILGAGGERSGSLSGMGGI